MAYNVASNTNSQPQKNYFLHMMTQTFTEKICEFVDQGRFYIKRLKYRYYA